MMSMAESRRPVTGNAPALEYPRLGRWREWMREHPRATNWLVTGLYVLLHLPGLLMMPITSQLFGTEAFMWLTVAVLAVQAVLIAGFVVYPGVGVMGLVFAAVWALIAYFRAEVARRYADRRAAGEDAGRSDQ